MTDADASVTAGVGIPSLRRGQSVCYGSIVLSNPGTRPATLESVRISGGAGLTVAAAQVLGSDRDITNATADTCPAGAPALQGYVVPPGAGTGHDLGIEVLLPIRIQRSGKSRITGVAIAYRVGGKHYVVEDPTDVVACTYACEARPGGR